MRLAVSLRQAHSLRSPHGSMQCSLNLKCQWTSLAENLTVARSNYGNYYASEFASRGRAIAGGLWSQAKVAFSGPLCLVLHHNIECGSIGTWRVCTRTGTFQLQVAWAANQLQRARSSPAGFCSSAARPFGRPRRRWPRRPPMGRAGRGRAISTLLSTRT